MRALKARVLTVSDLMLAERLANAAVAERLKALDLKYTYSAALNGADLGIMEYSKILVGMLTETEGEEL